MAFELSKLPKATELANHADLQWILGVDCADLDHSKQKY